MSLNWGSVPADALVDGRRAVLEILDLEKRRKSRH